GYTNPAYWTGPGWAWREASNRTQPYYWDDSTLNGDAQPVVGVNWFEAVAYARWLSAQTGREYRLPTEAEWEKAARGPDGLIWPWGNEWRDGMANSNEAGHDVTIAVGNYPDGASPYGALDMAGNVWEWCSSSWEDYPLAIEDEWSEQYLDQRQKYHGRIILGCSYRCSKESVRGANRYYYDARNHFDIVGIRLASYSPS
ncbi:MAG: formylglycine-generating enzyme family protein, partial [Chloroflexaceae bacterium]|nr:formylglycine-generating enzyme family protein [Chloroflexaceae bacterium]